MGYKYSYYATGAISLTATDTITQVELNRLTRFLFGEGAAANSVFNCGAGAFIKFQSRPELNKQRALLTTKIYRWLKRNNIPISHNTFKERRFIKDREPNFQDFLNHLTTHNEK